MELNCGKPVCGMKVFVPATQKNKGGLGEIEQVYGMPTREGMNYEVTFKGIPYRRFKWIEEIVAEQPKLITLYVHGLICDQAQPNPERVAPNRPPEVQSFQPPQLVINNG